MARTCGKLEGIHTRRQDEGFARSDQASASVTAEPPLHFSLAQSDENKAAQDLYEFINSQGGRIPAAAIESFFERHPEHKDIIRNVRNFCEKHNSMFDCAVADPCLADGAEAVEPAARYNHSAGYAMEPRVHFWMLPMPLVPWATPGMFALPAPPNSRARFSNRTQCSQQPRIEALTPGTSSADQTCSTAHDESASALSETPSSSSSSHQGVSGGQAAVTLSRIEVVGETQHPQGNDAPGGNQRKGASGKAPLCDLIPGHVQIDASLDSIVAVLPKKLQKYAKEQFGASETPPRKVILDCGMRARVFFGSTWHCFGQEAITKSDVNSVFQRMGVASTAGGCIGIDGTLHRVTPLQSPSGQVCGLTVHVGCATKRIADKFDDLITLRSSFLIIGPTASGKTTLLRDIARKTSRQPNGDVVVVDPVGQVGGYGFTAHPSVGMARRVAVAGGRKSAKGAGIIGAILRDHSPSTLMLDDPHTMLEASWIDPLVAAQGNGLQVICSVPGKLEELIQEGSFIASADALKTFDSAVLLGDPLFEEIRVVQNWRSAVEDIREGRQLAYEVRRFV